MNNVHILNVLFRKFDISIIILYMYMYINAFSCVEN